MTSACPPPGPRRSSASRSIYIEVIAASHADSPRRVEVAIDPPRVRRRVTISCVATFVECERGQPDIVATSQATRASHLAGAPDRGRLVATPWRGHPLRDPSTRTPGPDGIVASTMREKNGRLWADVERPLVANGAVRLLLGS